MADALANLVSTLGREQASPVIEIPALNDDGQLVLVSMVVGPFNGLISVPEHSPWPTPDLSDTVESLHVLTEAASKVPDFAFSDTIAFTDYDWDETCYIG
ncbi:hypothetical protein [Cryobacterium sp. PH29-G1]|uniref:hypothetical protein n=1 Tax=Cryobacterium sp. PH29-G1 TaxID=3046211 RepID=UPI0024BA9771|nr:hypothetical protein [Cryobacterium sp. PH29-G1]MDJ0350631.1 hypothetical protein [Cryobacterium sp. PH29-G1]